MSGMWMVHSQNAGRSIRVVPSFVHMCRQQSCNFDPCYNQDQASIWNRPALSNIPKYLVASAWLIAPSFCITSKKAWVTSVGILEADPAMNMWAPPTPPPSSPCNNFHICSPLSLIRCWTYNWTEEGGRDYESEEDHTPTFGLGRVACRLGGKVWGGDV